MAFKLGDVIIDRLQFGYGATSNGTPLYALTQLSETTIDVTADSSDIKDKDGNLVYRKYNGKTAEVNGTNTFMNLAVIETLSATDAEIATEENAIKMPYITTVKAGETLDITGYVKDSVTVTGLYNGAMGKEYKIGSKATETECNIKHTDAVAEPSENATPASDVLELPTNKDETEYLVKYWKLVKSGAKIVNSADKYPKAHELYFKALAIDPCDKENFKPVVVRIPSFIPSPEISLALQGCDSQTMDYKGAILADTCSADKVLFEVYFIDEDEAA